MGTWSLPQTLPQAEKLRSLLQQPIPATTAPDVLTELYSDDALFDVIDHIGKQYGPTADIRATLKYFIADALINKDVALEPWDREAYDLLTNLCSEYLPIAHYLHQLLHRPPNRCWRALDVLEVRSDLKMQQARKVIDRVYETHEDLDIGWDSLEFIADELFPKSSEVIPTADEPS